MGPENINPGGVGNQCIVSKDRRTVALVDNSADLIVDLGLSPLVPISVGPSLSQREQAGGSDSITSCPSTNNFEERELHNKSISMTQQIRLPLVNGSRGDNDERRNDQRGGPHQSVNPGAAKEKVFLLRNRGNKKKVGSRGKNPLPLGVGKMMKYQRRVRKATLQSKGNSVSHCSYSSSNFGWKNCLIENANPNEIAKGVWEFGKLIGVTSSEPEGVIVSRLEDMEVRDRRVAGRCDGVDGAT